jgi:hypothetical protein
MEMVDEGREKKSEQEVLDKWDKSNNIMAKKD